MTRLKSKSWWICFSNSVCQSVTLLQVKSSQVAFSKNKWQSHEFYEQVKWI